MDKLQGLAQKFAHTGFPDDRKLTLKDFILLDDHPYVTRARPWLRHGASLIRTPI